MTYNSFSYGSTMESITATKAVRNTLYTVSGMLMLTGITSLFTQHIHLGIGLALGVLVASIALIFGISKFQNSVLGLVGLAIFSVLDGVTLGPLLNAILHTPNGALNIGIAATVTALVCAGSAVFATNSKSTLDGLGKYLMVGTIVLLLMAVIGIFLQIKAFTLMILSLGTAIFAGWILYDVNRIVKCGEMNYVMASLSLFIDIMGFFRHLLSLLGMLNDD